MSDIKLENLSKIVPEGFYDIIGYVISAVYLIVGYLYATENLMDFKLPTLETSWVIDITLVFIIIGGLYVIGTIITTFSYWTLLKPYKWSLIKIKPSKYKDSFGYWGTKNLEWRIKYSSLIPEMTKRYARLIMTRNIAFVSLILLVLELFTDKYEFVFLIIFIISLLTFCIRAVWLEENYKALDKAIEEMEKK